MLCKDLPIAGLVPSISGLSLALAPALYALYAAALNEYFLPAKIFPWIIFPPTSCHCALFRVRLMNKVNSEARPRTFLMSHQLRLCLLIKQVFPCLGLCVYYPVRTMCSKGSSNPPLNSCYSGLYNKNSRHCRAATATKSS